MNRCLAFVVLFAALGSAACAMDIHAMSKAGGLVQILNKAGPCGYEIDETKLEDYYVREGLATPEALAYISAGTSLSGFAEPPSASDCTMARATGRQIGILK